MYLNKKNELVITRNWTFTHSKNPCVDEHHAMPGYCGLFTADGWCLIALVFRLRGWSIYHGEIGFCLLNHFVGFWDDGDAELYS